MARKKPVPKQLEEAYDSTNPKVCGICGGTCIRGDFSAVANFGVTREPHFVTSYGWMQVKYDRATAVDTYMCLKCGHIEFYGRQPLAVLDPLARQQQLREENPELDKKLQLEEKRRKELEGKGLPLEGDEHKGV